MIKSELLLTLVFALVRRSCSEDVPAIVFEKARPGARNIDSVEEFINEPDDATAANVKVAFVIFRHGVYSVNVKEAAQFFPFNEALYFMEGSERVLEMGKQQMFHLGKYLRKRYKGILSDKYNPNELEARTYNSSLGIQSIKSILKGLYPEEASVPYDIAPFMEDDLMFHKNCQKFLQLRLDILKHHNDDVKSILEEFVHCFDYVSMGTGLKMQTPYEIHRLVQMVALLSFSFNFEPPQMISMFYDDLSAFADASMLLQLYTEAQLKLAAGVMMNEIIDAINLVHDNVTTLRMYLAAGEDLNVAAWMAAFGVFVPHVPKCGSLFSIEICYLPEHDDYAVKAIYRPDDRTKTKQLEIKGCHKNGYCSTSTFKSMFEKYSMTFEQYLAECKVQKSNE